MRIKESIRQHARTARDYAKEHRPYLALLVFIALPMYAMGVVLTIRSGIFGTPRTLKDDQLKTFFTFIGGGLATVATVYGALLTKEHNAKDRRRLEFEAINKSLEAMNTGTPQRVGGVLSTTVLLGQPRVALRVLQPAWDADEVDNETATWIIDQVFASARINPRLLEGDRTDTAAILEASVMLRRHSSQLANPKEKGVFAFPGFFLRDWSVELPAPAKRNVLFSMANVLSSQGRAWWCGDGVARDRMMRWPMEVWIKCAEKDPDPDIRSTASLFISALADCFSEQIANSEKPMAKKIRDLSKNASGAPKGGKVLADKIRETLTLSGD